MGAHKSGSRDGKLKHSGGKHSGVSSSTPHGPSFLFVVNEFNIHDDVPGVLPERDMWGTETPATRAEAYGHEYVGNVFRYLGGTIQPAPDYIWRRQQQTVEFDETSEVPGPGYIARPSRSPDNGPDIFYDYPRPYKTMSVFACSKLLPIVVAKADASLGTVGLRNSYDSQVSTQLEDVWHLLHFSHSDRSQAQTRLPPGTSLANAQSQGCAYVAGTSPSWMPSLVPKVFANNERGGHVPESHGLAGELPLVIGLMAFHGSIGRASDVFHSGRWQGGNWQNNPASPVYPRAGELPRGFLIQVCLDNLDNPNGSTEDMLWNLEWDSTLVRG